MHIHTDVSMHTHDMHMYANTHTQPATSSEKTVSQHVYYTHLQINSLRTAKK